MGLKQWRGVQYARRHVMPQSNQRGIETQHLGIRDLENLIRLNRTSVGLKPYRIDRLASAKAVPQSNQRGIETMGLFCAARVGLAASIEPAWD